jgi:hypothetical protein
MSDLADVLYVRRRQKLADFGFEIIAVNDIDLGGRELRYLAAVERGLRLPFSLVGKRAVLLAFA